MPVTVPFSKSTVFEICRQKMCRFRVNGRPIRRIFHRFQNVPASCERSLSGDVETNPGPETLDFCCWNLNTIAVHDFLRISLIEARCITMI